MKPEGFELTKPLLTAWLLDAASYLPEGKPVPTLDKLIEKMSGNGWDHFTLRDMMDAMTEGRFRRNPDIFAEAGYFSNATAVIMALSSVKSPGGPDEYKGALSTARGILDELRSPAGRVRKLDTAQPK